MLNEKVQNMFPKKQNEHKMEKRKQRKYKTNLARTKRYRKSAIPYMAGLLNHDNEEEKNTDVIRTTELLLPCIQ